MMTCRRLWCSGLGSRLGTWTWAAMQLLSKHLWRFFVAVAVPSLLSVLEQVSIANASYFYANKVVANWNSNIPYIIMFLLLYELYVWISVFLIPCSGVIEMVVTQHIRILPVFYGIWMSILFSWSLQLTLSRASCIQSEPSYPISLRSL